MSDSTFKNVFTSTALTISVVFVGLMSALNIVQSQLPFESPPFSSNRLQYVPDKEYKDTTIRNVGLCILVSVGAGLVVAEVARKRRRANVTSQMLGAIASPTPDRPLPMGPALDRVEDPSQAELDLLPFQLSAADWVSPQVFSPSSHMHRSLEDTAAIDRDNLPSDFLVTLANTPVTRLSTTQAYQTCHVLVPHLQQRLFAILWNGEYYSFVKAGHHQEHVLHLAQVLADRGDRVVITSIGDKYVAWIWQPHAVLDMA